MTSGRRQEVVTLTPTSARLDEVNQVRKRLHMDTECSADAGKDGDKDVTEDGEEEIDVMGDVDRPSANVAGTSTDVSSTSNSSGKYNPSPYKGPYFMICP